MSMIMPIIVRWDANEKRCLLCFMMRFFRGLIIEKLRLYWTPHGIAGYLKRYYPTKSVCAETIYRFIYSRYGRRLKLYKLLKYKHKKRIPYGSRKQRCGSTIRHRTSIHERHISVQNRQEVGHWEADLIINKGGNISVLCERKTRFLRAIKNDSKHADLVMSGIKSKMKMLPNFLKSSMTFDQGTEFSRHQDLTNELNIKTYFCDPYSPWQKGQVENANGRLRRFIPKKSDITHISQKQLDHIIDIMNNTPRACLDYQSPSTLFNAYLTKPCRTS